MSEPRGTDTSALRRALGAIEGLQQRVAELEASRSEPIAIIGMGCRFPGDVTTPEAFWDFLQRGGNGVVEVPPDRWDVDEFHDPDPDAPGRITSRHGGFVRDIDQFDPAFFGISPREAAAMDPQQRLLLEVSWEALEHAAVAPDRLRETRTGVFVGMTASDYATLQYEARGPEGIDAYYASGVSASTASGRLSYVLGLRGPAVTVDTACSSSLVATHLAVQSLRTGDSDLALAGGVNLILAPDNSIALSRYHMLAPDGRCKTFDAAADGFVRGEGCGVVVLRRLRDAVEAGDPIIAVIRGSAVNQDGASSGLTAPNGPSQVSVIRDALADAELAPAAVGYVEAHGTGTALGDPIEVQALDQAYGSGRTQPLAIGSVKTNVGHLEGVAGIAGLMKAALVVHHGTIPPHLHLDTPSPHIPWDDLDVRVPVESTSLPVEPSGHAAVSAFGFSGTNAHVVLEAPPAPAPTTPDEPATALFALSAGSPDAARRAAEATADRLTAGVPAADVARTLAAGRAALPHRIAVVGDPVVAASQLRAAPEPIRAADERRVGFLFTGQGSQWSGMGAGLRTTEPVFRTAFDDIAARFDARLADHLPTGTSLVDIVTDDDHAELLGATLFTQPALFAVEYALAELWESWGVRPAMMLGHSIGEIVAASRSGVLGLDDAVELVAVRADLMQSLPGGGAMTAIFADADAVEAAVAAAGSDVAVAAVNGPRHVVVSGAADAVESVAAGFAEQGAKVNRLHVSHAFHSPLMEPMTEAFGTALRSLQFSAATRRVVSNVSGGPAGAELSTPEYWVQHVLAPVRFHDGIQTMVEAGIDTFIEIGPHPVLTAMGQTAMPDTDAVWVSSLRRDTDARQTVLQAVATTWSHGLPVDLGAVAQGGTRRHLPTTPFDRQRHWFEGGRRSRAVADHPLLGRRRPAPDGTTTFEADIDTDGLALLADHRVFGAAILPATAFLEAAHAAAVAVDPTSTGLADVVIREPLIAGDEPHQLTTIVEPVEDRLRIDVHSTTDGSTWRHHVSATALHHTDPAPALDLAAERSVTTARVTATEHRATLAAAGLEFGPALHTVDSIETGPDVAIGRIVTPADARPIGVHTDPAVLDGAVQILAAVDDSGDTYLPLAIERVVHHRPLGPSGWSVARFEPAAANADIRRADILVVDDEGRVAVELHGVSLKRADRAALHRIGSASRVDDWLYTLAWHQRDTAPAGGHDVEPDEIVDAIRGHVTELETSTGMRDAEPLLPALERLATHAIDDALTQLGVGDDAGAAIDPEALGIAEQHRKVFAQLVGFLVEDGTVEQDGTGWRRRYPKTHGERVDTDDLLARHLAAAGEIRIASRCAVGLADALRGTADPLELLFPAGDPSDAESMYTTSPFARFANGLMAETVDRIVTAAGRVDGPVRLIEIGGGTGGTTTHVLPRLRQHDVSYTFTDISPHFVTRARGQFGGGPVEFGTLDIEVDPVEQGFAAAGYDVVIATNVLHATTDLATTFANVGALLRPGGHLVMLEMVVPQRFIAISFGLTDGWWRFTDEHLRPDSLLLGRGEWLEFLNSSGFGSAAALPHEPDSSAQAIQAVFVARRGGGSDRSVRIVAGPATTDELAAMLTTAAVRVAGEGHRATHTVHAAALDPRIGAAEVLSSALAATQQALTDGSSALVFITRGGQAIDGRADPTQATLAGFARSVALEHRELEVRLIDLDPGPAFDLARAVAEVTDGEEELVAWRGDRRFVGRLERAEPAPDAEPSEIVCRTRGSLDNLTTVPLTRSTPGPGEVEIGVHASALNFKDVLNVLGMYPGDPGPLGGECAGVVTAVGAGVDDLRVGQSVAALVPGAFRSHVVCDARFVVPKPADLPFAHAAGVLIPSITASFSLQHLGRLSAGDHVLVQAAAGGVGLAAVHLAHHLGATVHATAGTPEKRAMLERLGVASVHDSRSTDFADEIRSITGGVDVVLNSIAGESVDAAVGLLRPGGRFLELGKTDLLEADDPRLDSIEYHVIDWTDDMRRDPELIAGHAAQAMALTASGALPEPVVTCFPFGAATAAFRFMANARHTGKIILTRPDAPLASQREIPVAGTHLITGGLRGLGLVTARALVGHGVRSLALIGRREPDAAVAAELDRWRADGVRVLVELGDVTEPEVLRDLVRRIESEAEPITGVFHAAGVLDDAAVLNLVPEQFDRVLATKAGAATELDRLTADHPVEVFVLYSSIASLLGSAGQANHAAANAHLDALAHARRARGRPAVSIGWGAWSEVGAAAERGVDRAAAAGPMGALSPDEGIQALWRVIERGDVQVGVNRGDLGEVVRAHGDRTLFRDLRSALARTATPDRAPNAGRLEGLDDADREAALEMLAEHVRGHAAAVLELPAERVDDRSPLSDLGLDSLMAVELRNRLGDGLGLDEPLSATLVFDYPTVTAIADHLLELVRPGTADAVEDPEPAAADSAPSALLDALESLSDEEFEKRLARRQDES